MWPKARPSAPDSSPVKKIRSIVPKPVAALYKAGTDGKSAEQKRLNAVVPVTKLFEVVFQVFTVCIKSLPLCTVKSDLLITHFDTNAPFEPCARAIPEVFPNSWFINKVNVPLLLSYAPNPSGIPTILYPPISSFTDKIEVYFPPIDCDCK